MIYKSSIIERTINLSNCLKHDIFLLIWYRKIAIYRYSASMRQQFVRLLAIVKWATKAEKIEKCFVSIYNTLFASVS